MHAALMNGPRKGMGGPFAAWLLSPGLADPAQQLGAFLRFESELPAKLRELAILVTARATTAQYEWFAHRPLAEQAGLASAIIEAIRARTLPRFTDADEALTYDVATALNSTRTLDDALYGRALARFGARGMVEFVGLIGYYTMVAMTLNVFDAEVPDGVTPPLGP